MSTVSQGQPYTENGLERPYFFNGRVLTAEALRQAQASEDQRLARLARGVGTGILHGFYVTQDGPDTVTVEAGAGIARSGDVLELPETITLALVADLESSVGGARTDFQTCSGALASPDFVSGSGLYLIAAARATAPKGRAPSAGLGGGSAAPCNRSATVEGVCFHLIPVPGLLAGLEEDIKRAIQQGEDGRTGLRNLVAHAGLGSVMRQAWTSSLVAYWRNATEAGRPADRSNAFTGDPLDGLREDEKLPDTHLPLALFYWDDAVKMVEPWAVRRPVHPWMAASGFGFPVQGPTLATGDAAIRQFQTQVKDEEATPSDVFHTYPFLPPAGMIPLGDKRSKAMVERIQALNETEKDLTTKENEWLGDHAKQLRELLGQSAQVSDVVAHLRDLNVQYGAVNVYGELLEEPIDEPFRRLTAEDEPVKVELERLEILVKKLEGAIEDTAVLEEDTYTEGPGKIAQEVGAWRVQLWETLGLPWWLFRTPLEVLPDAAVGPLFDAARSQPSIRLPKAWIRAVETGAKRRGGNYDWLSDDAPEFIRKPEVAGDKGIASLDKGLTRFLKATQMATVDDVVRPPSIRSLRLYFVEGDLRAGKDPKDIGRPSYLLFSQSTDPTPYETIAPLLSSSIPSSPVAKAKDSKDAEDLKDTEGVKEYPRDSLTEETKETLRKELARQAELEKMRKEAEAKEKDAATDPYTRTKYPLPDAPEEPPKESFTPTYKMEMQFDLNTVENVLKTRYNVDSVEAFVNLSPQKAAKMMDVAEEEITEMQASLRKQFM